MEGLEVAGGNIDVLMAKAMANINAIPKMRQPNEGGIKFSYRGIDDLYNAFHAIFAELGIIVTIEDIAPYITENVTSKKEGYKKESTNAIRGFIYTIAFVAADGSKRTTKSVGEGFDASDKAAGKATSYAMKTALIHTFLVPTVDLEDPDASNPEIGAGESDKPGEYKTPTVAALKDEVIAYMQVRPPVYTDEWQAYADACCKKNDQKGLQECINEAKAVIKAGAPK